MEILSILMQVAQSEHESEERVIVRYRETEQGEIKSKIINKSSLSGSDLTKWNNFVTLINGKL